VRGHVRYPSGLGARLPERLDDVAAWAAQVAIAMDEQPIGLCAPCQNPECTGPVDRLPTTQGVGLLYCSHHCRSRASTLRLRAEQQLDALEELLAVAKGKHGIPRKDLQERIQLIRWWLDRLPTAEDRSDRRREH
jgi:hypothetical protein